MVVKVLEFLPQMLLSCECGIFKTKKNHKKEIEVISFNMFGDNSNLWKTNSLATPSASADLPLCALTRPTDSWLSCWLPQLLPCCYTTNSWLCKSQEIFMTGLKHRQYPVRVLRWTLLSSWEWPTCSQVFVEWICMLECLILHACGHERDCNTWIQ